MIAASNSSFAKDGAFSLIPSSKASKQVVGCLLPTFNPTPGISFKSLHSKQDKLSEMTFSNYRVICRDECGMRKGEMFTDKFESKFQSKTTLYYTWVLLSWLSCFNALHLFSMKSPNVKNEITLILTDHNVEFFWAVGWCTQDPTNFKPVCIQIIRPLDFHFWSLKTLRKGGNC